MKRLFGLTGILYLATLTAVFYFKSWIIIGILIICSAVLISLGIIKRFQQNRYMFKTYIISAATILLAMLSIFLYQNYYVDPILNNYSDKEIFVEGYICEEINYKDKSVEYLVQTTAIDHNPVFTKMKYTGYSENELKEFDYVNLHVKAYAENNKQNIGHRILLRAYESTPYSITPTGKNRFSVYKYAITLRKEIRSSLNTLMPGNSAGLSRAILLGDKYALESSDLQSFKRTGTSFLIVVSGLHLSIATSVVMLVMRKITRRRIILSISAIVAVIGFSALTGFNYSVIRAGIAVILYYLGRILLRNSEPLNSLGFAGLAITIFNPYAVGDLGLLMSFSATLGIILWSKKLSDFIIGKAGLEINKGNNKFVIRIKKILCFFVNLFSVSISASIWIIPITVIAFGTITPMTAVISTITEPLASLILIISLICAILSLFPFMPVITYLFAFVNNLLCKMLLNINGFFAQLHSSSIKANRIEVYIWLAVSVLLVIIGCLIKAKKTYVIIAANISFALMLTLSVIAFITADKSCKLTLYQSGSGYCAEVKKENNISLLNAGGNSKTFSSINEDIFEAESKVDYLIIPNSNNNVQMLQDISQNFVISNLITEINSAEDMALVFDDIQYIIEENTIQTVHLNSKARVTLIDVKGVVYQYLQLEAANVLFVPANSNTKSLPEKYRTADYTVLSGIPKNIDLLNCDSIIYAGSMNSYYKEKLSELKELYPCLTVLNNSKLEIK